VKSILGLRQMELLFLSRASPPSADGEEGEDEDDQALAQSEGEEGALIARSRRSCSQSGPTVIAAPAPKPAAVAPAARPRRSGTPFQGVFADAGAVHGAGADAADDRGA